MKLKVVRLGPLVTLAVFLNAQSCWSQFFNPNFYKTSDPISNIEICLESSIFLLMFDTKFEVLDPSISNIKVQNSISLFVHQAVDIDRVQTSSNFLY